ncbi:hypothetical protein [Effusibacillus consociatus]|uniref:Uncharacterized protein n=1 Tax=Effusibacillus consociatus TaxID=1117041 RepID=A0ABV9Q5E2_9BACL
MNEKDVVSNLIRNNRLSHQEIQQILALSTNEIISTLIGLKGGFVYRAYLLERLMELTGGPRGLAVPESIYEGATAPK